MDTSCHGITEVPNRIPSRHTGQRTIDFSHDKAVTISETIVR